MQKFCTTRNEKILKITILVFKQILQESKWRDKLNKLLFVNEEITEEVKDGKTSNNVWNYL